jgi:hypothetical protein
MNALLIKIGESGLPIVIAAIIAFFGAMISAIIALSIARRNTYLTTVTAERSKWIDKIRNNISKFAAICAYVHYKYSTSKFGDSSEHDEIIRKLENLEALILSGDIVSTGAINWKNCQKSELRCKLCERSAKSAI